MPERIKLSRRKGWRMPENTVKVDRTTALGNPFITGTHGTRLECVAAYALAIDGHIRVSGGPEIDAQIAAYHAIRERAEALEGKNLACWCSLPKPGEPDICHARIILDCVNMLPRSSADSTRIIQAWQARKTTVHIYIHIEELQRRRAEPADA